MAQVERGLRVVVKEDDKGGPEKLLTEEFDVPEPNDDQVLVKVHAAGVNFIDTYHRSGLYPNVTRIGKEGSGTVTSVGSNVTTLQSGDKVCWFAVQGSYSTHILGTPSQLLKIPPQLISSDTSDFKSNESNSPNIMDTAACIPLQALTAHYLCNSTYPVGPNDTVLVHAGAGGTGGLLIQMCKILGCSCVIATVSNDTKAEIARGHGADYVINYNKSKGDNSDNNNNNNNNSNGGGYEFLDDIKEITGGKLCNVVFDGVGKMTADQSILSVKSRGMVVFFGNASGPVPPIDPLRLAKQGSISVCRPRLPDYVIDEKERLDRVKDIFGWIKEGKLKIRIGMKFGLNEARNAHEALEGRKTTGKIILSAL